MNTPTMTNLAVDFLLRPSVPVVLAFIVIRMFRVSHPVSKHAIWTAALAGMLAVSGASFLAPALEVPILPETTARTPEPAIPSGAGPEAAAWPTAPGAHVPSASPHEAKAPDPLSPAEGVRSAPAVMAGNETVPAAAIMIWIYLAGVGVMIAFRIAGSMLLRRVLARSRPLRGRLRVSPDVAVPLAAGLLQPVVLLPEDWRRWRPEVRRAVLSHEFAHVRRRDLQVLAVSRWVRSILWFHPAAWWVVRRIAELAEMSCDAAVAGKICTPARYSEILVEFAGQVGRRGRRATLPGLAMAGDSPLGRRIDGVFAMAAGRSLRLKHPALVVLLGLPALALSSMLHFTEGIPVLQAPSTLLRFAGAPIVGPQPIPGRLRRHSSFQRVRPRSGWRAGSFRRERRLSCRENFSTGTARPVMTHRRGRPTSYWIRRRACCPY